MKTDICGAFPLLVTPWTEDARLDTEVLAREAEYVARCGVGGLVWPTAGEAIWTLSSDEYEAGLRTLAERSVEKGYSAFVVAVCPGKDSAEALSRAYVAQRIANETGARMAILARPPDSATDQPAIEAHYRALAGVANMPVIIQTFNDGKSPQPDIELLARLARDFPAVFGWVKEESPGLKVNSLMAELLAHPEIKKVLSGFGAKAWMFQGTKIGTYGIISQRPAYAPLFARIYTLMKEGRGCDDPEMAGLCAKYLYMCNLGDTLAESDDAMRGPHLYVLQRLGIFRNRLTRDGNGVITDYPMTDAEKREVEERMHYCGLSPFDGCVTSKVSPHAVPHRSPRAKDGKIFNEIEAGKTVGIELRRPDGTLAEDRIEDVLRKLFVIGTGEWVIIHCPEGAFGLSRNGTFAVERSKALPKGYKVGSVGAGDAFCAGVLFAAYRGLSIGDALVYGNASAQVSLRHASASGGMTTIDEALAEYRRF